MNRPAWGWSTPLAAILTVALMVTPFGTVIDFFSRAANIPDGKLLDVNDSAMGRIALMEAVAGKSIHYSGTRVEDLAQRPAAVRAAYLSFFPINFREGCCSSAALWRIAGRCWRSTPGLKYIWRTLSRKC